MAELLVTLVVLAILSAFLSWRDRECEPGRCRCPRQEADRG